MPELTPELMAVKARHAPRLERAAFEAKVLELWPKASKLALHPDWLVAMWETHQAIGLSPTALVAGFADASKSKYLR